MTGTGRHARFVIVAGLLAMSHSATASASPLFGTQSPSPADRGGLTRAFNRAHRSRRSLKLLGFRAWDDPKRGAAAYYLTRAPGGGYSAGDVEYYRRTSGHNWKHVSKLKPLVEGNLLPGFSWRVETVGTGTSTYRF